MILRSRKLKILGVLVALATLVATIGSEPALTDRPAIPAGLDVGAPHWSSEPSEATLGQLAGQPSQHAEQFYFALPDRFANGDPSNDRGGTTGDRMTTGYDPTDKGFYHGGDIKG